MRGCTALSAEDCWTRMSLLSCRDLACGYSGRPVLSGLEAEVQAGEIIVLLGPNGSGKSTLLKTLGAWLPPISGQVLIGGRSADRLSRAEVAQHLAYVPQEEFPAFPFTARQIVLMGRLARSQGLMDTPEDYAIAERSMARSDCLEFADRPVTELSGGERQRVLIARALASEAKVLLLDEPSSHLDAAHVVGLVELLKQLSGEGCAVVVAVHDLNVASLLGSRALLLGDGRLLHDGGVEDVLTGPSLEGVYGIRFERLRDARGRLRVFPEDGS